MWKWGSIKDSNANQWNSPRPSWIIAAFLSWPFANRCTVPDSFNFTLSRFSWRVVRWTQSTRTADSVNSHQLARLTGFVCLSINGKHGPLSSGVVWSIEITRFSWGSEEMRHFLVVRVDTGRMMSLRWPLTIDSFFFHCGSESVDCQNASNDRHRLTMALKSRSVESANQPFLFCWPKELFFLIGFNKIETMNHL